MIKLANLAFFFGGGGMGGGCVGWWGGVGGYLIRTSVTFTVSSLPAELENCRRQTFFYKTKNAGKGE